VHAATITAWMGETAAAVRAEREYLTQLDAAIGDGDHGINMNRGFDAVSKALAVQGNGSSPGRLLIVVGKTLVSTVGGASGPLWGTAFRRAGRALGDAPEFDGTTLLRSLDAAVAGIVDEPIRRQLEILARMPVRRPSSPRYAPHSQAATATSTGASSGNSPIVP